MKSQASQNCKVKLVHIICKISVFISFFNNVNFFYPKNKKKESYKIATFLAKFDKNCNFCGIVHFFLSRLQNCDWPSLLDLVGRIKWSGLEFDARVLVWNSILSLSSGKRSHASFPARLKACLILSWLRGQIHLYFLFCPGFHAAWLWMLTQRFLRKIQILLILRDQRQMSVFLCWNVTLPDKYSTYFRASWGSLVPDRLTEVRARALLKNCLKDGGISLPFLHGGRGRRGRYQIKALLETRHVTRTTLKSLNRILSQENYQQSDREVIRHRMNDYLWSAVNIWPVWEDRFRHVENREMLQRSSEQRRTHLQQNKRRKWN